MFQQLTDFGTDAGRLRPSLTFGSEQEQRLTRWKRPRENRLQGRGVARAHALRVVLARYGEELP